MISFQSLGPDSGRDWNMSDLDSTESDEMTAEAQNQSNAEADDVHSLLSNFMQAKEETLEDLLGGLMFLTMGRSWSRWSWS